MSYVRCLIHESQITYHTHQFYINHEKKIAAMLEREPQILLLNRCLHKGLTFGLVMIIQKGPKRHLICLASLCLHARLEKKNP